MSDVAFSFGLGLIARSWLPDATPLLFLNKTINRQLAPIILQPRRGYCAGGTLNLLKWAMTHDIIDPKTDHISQLIAKEGNLVLLNVDKLLTNRGDMMAVIAALVKYQPHKAIRFYMMVKQRLQAQDARELKRKREIMNAPKRRRTSGTLQLTVATATATTTITTITTTTEMIHVPPPTTTRKPNFLRLVEDEFVLGAAIKGNVSLIKELRAKVNAKRGKTFMRFQVLQAACHYGHLNVLELCAHYLEFGICIKLAEALHDAAFKGNAPHILDRFPNFRNHRLTVEQKLTQVDIATKAGHVAILQWVVEKLQSRDEDINEVVEVIRKAALNVISEKADMAIGILLWTIDIPNAPEMLLTKQVLQHLELVQALRQRGVPWTPNSAMDIVLYGSPAVLFWAVEEGGCSYPEALKCLDALITQRLHGLQGHGQMCEWMINTMGLRMTETTAINIVSYGNNELIDKIPVSLLTPVVMTSLARTFKTEAMRKAILRGGVVNHKTVTTAAHFSDMLSAIFGPTGVNVHIGSCKKLPGHILQGIWDIGFSRMAELTLKWLLEQCSFYMPLSEALGARARFWEPRKYRTGTLVHRFIREFYTKYPVDPMTQQSISSSSLKTLDLTLSDEKEEKTTEFVITAASPLALSAIVAEMDFTSS